MKVLKNKLSEYVRIAAAGETVLVTDRGVVVAELSPPSSVHSAILEEALLAEVVRQGWLVPPANLALGPVPRAPVARVEDLLRELDGDRSDR